MWEAITTSITGAFVWELIRSSLGQIFKHLQAKSNFRRAALRAQLKDIERQLEPLVQLAMEYYGGPSHAGALKFRSIKLSLAALELAVESVNVKLEKAKMKEVGLSHLISFRQNLTIEAQFPRGKPLDVSDPILKNIMASTQRLRDDLYDRSNDLA